MKNYNKNENKGFTLVELMIAAAIFGMVLLIVSIGFIQVGRLFYKGTSLIKIQEATRNLTDEISQQLQFGTSKAETQTFKYGVGGAETGHVLCTGSARYFIYDDKPVKLTVHDSGIEKFSKAGSAEACDASRRLEAEAVQLLGYNMRVPKEVPLPRLPSFYVKCNNELCKVQIRLAFGDDKTFSDNEHTICRGAVNGTQFCGVSSLEVLVIGRLK